MSHALTEDPAWNMSVEGFLEWASANDGRWQLVDGLPVAMAPPSRTHGAIQAEVARLLGNALAKTRPECSAVVEGGVIPRISVAQNFRIPDVVVTCAPDRPGRHDVEAPVLIVEILSPSNQAQTWTNLWAYSTIPSLQEMLVIDSETVAARLFRRQADQSWPMEPALFEADDTIHLEAIGLEIRLLDLYRTTRLALDPYPPA